MRGDEHVGEGEQARQLVVLQNLAGEILEEDAFFFLVDVEPDTADVGRTSTPRSTPLSRPVRRG